MEQDSNNNNGPQIPDLKDTDLFKFLNKFKFSIIGLLIVGLFFYNAVFQVDTSENAVMLRLGKYSHTTGPGLHFKVPLIDTYELVPVKEAQTAEFGFVDFDDAEDQYISESDEIVSLMMTNNPSIMEVIWNVQYRITDPKAYLFNVVDVKNTIRDISEAAMRMQIGDNSFEKILNNRDELTLEEDVLAFMQNILGPNERYDDIGLDGCLDEYETGWGGCLDIGGKTKEGDPMTFSYYCNLYNPPIDVIDFDLCSDQNNISDPNNDNYHESSNSLGFEGNGQYDLGESFEDENGNGQRDINYNTGITITEVKITSAKYPNAVASAFDEVFKAQKDKDISVTNANEQKIAAVNKAKGEVSVFDSLLAAYNNYPKITKSIMALDAQERIFRKVRDKTIIDSNLEGLLQHLDLGGKK